MEGSVGVSGSVAKDSIESGCRVGGMSPMEMRAQSQTCSRSKVRIGASQVGHRMDGA